MKWVRIFHYFPHKYYEFFFRRLKIFKLIPQKSKSIQKLGKVFCLLYAIIGIPLTLVLLSAVVERLMTPVNWFLGTLNARLGHLYQPFNIRIIHLSIVVTIVIILFFAIPTVIFNYMEDSWNGIDAFYYCFISLT